MNEQWPKNRKVFFFCNIFDTAPDLCVYIYAKYKFVYENTVYIYSVLFVMLILMHKNSLAESRCIYLKIK